MGGECVPWGHGGLSESWGASHRRWYSGNEGTMGGEWKATGINRRSRIGETCYGLVLKLIFCSHRW